MTGRKPCQLTYADQLSEEARQKEAENAPQLLPEAAPSGEGSNEAHDKDGQARAEASA